MTSNVAYANRLTSVTDWNSNSTTYDFDAFGNRIEVVTGASSVRKSSRRAVESPQSTTREVTKGLI